MLCLLFRRLSLIYNILRYTCSDNIHIVDFTLSKLKTCDMPQFNFIFNTIYKQNNSTIDLFLNNDYLYTSINLRAYFYVWQMENPIFMIMYVILLSYHSSVVFSGRHYVVQGEYYKVPFIWSY